MIDLDGPWFVDKETNRTILFHGINVGGGAKLPVGIPSHSRKGFWVDYDRKVTFVGRPFPLEDADMHFERLVALGFNLLRFVITWEAIEHEGPGIYDHDYLDYVIQLLKKCQHYRLKVFIDPHQDTWSRHCGGSGHPGWTLTLAGLNPSYFNETVAALVQNTYDKPATFPPMIWNTNYQRLAAATMFTLFFAGKAFAPHCIIDQIHIQDYLQAHFFKAITQLTARIQQHQLEDNVVIGYDTMNEPGHGFLGFPDLSKLDESDTSFKMGLMPTPFQGMMLGSGIACKVANYEFIWSGPKKKGEILVDPNQGNGDDKVVTAWLTQEELDESCMAFGWKRSSSWEKAGCIWEHHGIWDKSTGTLLLPHYFASHPISGKPTHFAQDYWVPFLTSYIKAIRSIHTTAIIFVQPPILDKPPKLPTDDPLYQRLVYTPHWYDGLTLVKKKWCNYNIDFINLNRGKYGTGPLRFIRALCLGEKAIRNCFVKQLKTVRAEGLEQIGDYPCLIGEIGIPYDMQNDAALATIGTPVETIPEQDQRGWKHLWYWLISLFSGSRESLSSTTVTASGDIGSPSSSQNKAMDASINAVESALLNYTLWQYVPDNDPFWGDRWNGEDLSVWQQLPETGGDTTPTTVNEQVNADTDIAKIWTESTLSTINADTSSLAPKDEYLDKNVMLLPGVNQRDLVCLHRPRPRFTAGIPIAISFTSPTSKIPAYYRYEFQLRVNLVNSVTEIYVPKVAFPTVSSDTTAETQVTVSDGQWKVHFEQEDYWILHWWLSAFPNETSRVKEQKSMVLELRGIRTTP